MNRLLPILSICIAGCMPAVAPPAPITAATDGYDLHLGKAFRTTDGRWNWKWRLYEGGAENFQDEARSDGRFSILTHVTGTDPHGNAVSYLCKAKVDFPPDTTVTRSSKIPSCTHEHGVEVFAPLKVTRVERSRTLAGELNVGVEISLIPTSWLTFEPRVVGVAAYEGAS